MIILNNLNPKYYLDSDLLLKTALAALSLISDSIKFYLNSSIRTAAKTFSTVTNCGTKFLLLVPFRWLRLMLAKPSTCGLPQPMRFELFYALSVVYIILMLQY
jgi:hypothetical protein